MDFVKIATQIGLKVAVIEVATMDAVVVVVVLAEVDAATVMTATLVASRSMHHPIFPTRFLFTDPCFHSDHVKQADQSWGAPTGESEWKDEQAGEAIAKAEEKDEGTAGGWDASAATTGDGWDSGAAAISTDAAPIADADGTAPAEGSTPANAPAEPVAEPEPEDNSRSYADYLAEQAEKKLKLGGGVPEARKPNEGSKDKKYANAKPVAKDEGQDFFSGKSEKAKRERQRKEKNILDIDIKYAEPQTGRGGGDRGGRGGRGRGDRGDFRGRGRGRGDGFRGRGDGNFRGGRGGGRGDSGSVNVQDENAFPSLGGS